MRLARTLPIHLLPIHAPPPPDRYICSPLYGTGIEPFDCQFIVDTYWPTGKTPVHYYFTKPVPSNGVALPVISNSVGWDSTCQVLIEPAGPSYRYPPYRAFSPEMLRGLAGYVIQKCAAEEAGFGGFVTIGLRAAELYLEGWVDSRDESGGKNDSNSSQPPDGVYLTVSITGKNKTRFAPGDTDPIIAGYLSRYAAMSSQLYNEKLASWLAIANFLRDRAIAMMRGPLNGVIRVWWDGTGLEAYTAHSSMLHGAGGANTNRQGSQPDSDYSDWTNSGGGPWKNVGAGSGQQSQNGSPSDNGEESNQDEVTDEGDGEMAYLCDTSNSQSQAPVAKGSTPGAVGPDPIDCEKLSWSGLPGSSNPTSLLTLEAPVLSSSSNDSIGRPIIFTYGTCNLAVFATSSQTAQPPPTPSHPPSAFSSNSAANVTNGEMTISWAHILAAFETLTNLCVINPLYPKKSMGGVAFWSEHGQGVESWIHGKKSRRKSKRRHVGRKTENVKRESQKDEGRKWTANDPRLESGEAMAEEGRLRSRDGVDGVDGMIALPRGVNLTVFRTGAETVPEGLAGVLECRTSDRSGPSQERTNSSTCIGVK